MVEKLPSLILLVLPVLAVIFMLKVKKKKNADIICYKLTSLVSSKQGNVKKSRKSMKIANIDRKILHNF